METDIHVARKENMTIQPVELLIFGDALSLESEISLTLVMPQQHAILCKAGIR